MAPSSLLPFFFLTLSFLSLWFRRDPKIWGSLLGLALLSGFIASYFDWLGLLFILGMITLWISYAKKPTLSLFLILILAFGCFSFRLLPGFSFLALTPKFRMGLQSPIIAFLPLPLLVPLARTAADWKRAGLGFLAGCAGIAILAFLATFAGATHGDFKLPTHFPLRIWSNFTFTSIPEEAFYRGFLQRELCRIFQQTRLGNFAALFLTSALFTSAHLFWSQNGAILGFVFLAGLLYGGVYLLSGKIEGAILTHFLLNLMHMFFFSYHAM